MLKNEDEVEESECFLCINCILVPSGKVIGIILRPISQLANSVLSACCVWSLVLGTNVCSDL